MQERRVLREAIAAVERGDKVVARQLLGQILRSDPACAEAWLWMSRAVTDDRQRRECLRRALSPDGTNAAGDEPFVSSAESTAGSLSPYSTADPVFSDGLADGGGFVLHGLTTRSDLDAELVLLSNAQRQTGQRRIMLTSALTLSLLCGLGMLIFLLATAVPRAQDRIVQRYQSTPYTAILWCPSCEASGEPLTLWSRPSALFRAKVGALDHGAPVSVVAEQWVAIEGRMYAQVEDSEQSGWVEATYVKR
jgi:hypothetical protein